MHARVHSFVLEGVNAAHCEVEVDLADNGLSREQIVGLPGAAVRESLDRVRSAIVNAGYAFPAGRLLINLAPADVRKEGPVYELPMAIGLLAASGVIHPLTQEERASGALGLSDCLLAGELALDGRVRPVRGVLSMASLARDAGKRAVIVPAENAPEAAVVEGVDALGVRTIQEVVGLLCGRLPIEPHPPVDVSQLIEHAGPTLDFAEVRGQESVKRSITIAAGGGHNLLMVGPAGSGKSMMAKALPGVLPPLSSQEALEVTRIYSAVGELTPASAGGAGLVTRRPVRAPHHTSSAPALIGGGAIPRPGEISLAHHGVLFLDELPEFSRVVLETLRQPLEDDGVTISRAHSSTRFPASFMFVAAMNPTPKGHMPVNGSDRREMDRYLARLSGPLLDRIDIHVEAPAVPWKKLADRDAQGTSSAQMRDRVLLARRRQASRQGRTLNAKLRGKALDAVAHLDDTSQALLGQALTELGLSARAYDKIRRVARTIADTQDEVDIKPAHVAEAIQYRLLDRNRR